MSNTFFKLLQADIKEQILKTILKDCPLVFCEDTSHQAIRASKDVNGKRSYTVIDDECVGCNLCELVCPEPACISMVEVENGKPYMNWGDHPNNPMRRG